MAQRPASPVFNEPLGDITNFHNAKYHAITLKGLTGLPVDGPLHVTTDDAEMAEVKAIKLATLIDVPGIPSNGQTPPGLDAQLQAMQNTILDMFVKSNENIQNSISDLKKSIAETNGKITKIDVDLRAVKTDLAAVKAELTADLRAVKADLATVKADLTADLRTVKADLATVKADLATVKADLTADLKADLTTQLQAELRTMKADLAADLKADLTTQLRTELRTMKADLTAHLQAELLTFRTEINGQFAGTTARLDGIDTRLGDMNTRLITVHIMAARALNGHRGPGLSVSYEEVPRYDGRLPSQENLTRIINSNILNDMTNAMLIPYIEFYRNIPPALIGAKRRAVADILGLSYDTAQLLGTR